MTDKAAAAAGTTAAKTTVFSRVSSWLGRVALGAFHIANKADQVIDAEEPELVSVLERGESLAKYIPGVNTKIVPFLNGGIEVLGAAKATIDGTVALEPEIQAQINVLLADKGLNVILVSSDVWTDVKALWATYEAEYNVAATAVNALDPSALKKTTTAPVAGFAASSNLSQAPGGEPLGAAAQESKPAPLAPVIAAPKTATAEAANEEQEAKAKAAADAEAADKVKADEAAAAEKAKAEAAAAEVAEKQKAEAAEAEQAKEAEAAAAAKTAEAEQQTVEQHAAAQDEAAKSADGSGVHSS